LSQDEKYDIKHKLGCARKMTGAPDAHSSLAGPRALDAYVPENMALFKLLVSRGSHVARQLAAAAECFR
jgi:hypothetical protein